MGYFSSSINADNILCITCAITATPSLAYGFCPVILIQGFHVWLQMGQNRNFVRLYFSTPCQNVLKSDMKKSQIFPIWDLGPIWPTSEPKLYWLVQMFVIMTRRSEVSRHATVVSRDTRSAHRFMTSGMPGLACNKTRLTLHDIKKSRTF